jgi:hypothetical protein
MKRQSVARILALSLFGLFLPSVAGCGKKATTSLSKEEFREKVGKMCPDEIVKWLGKPTRVTDDNGSMANWHYTGACYDKLTGKIFSAEIHAIYGSCIDAITGRPSKYSTDFGVKQAPCVDRCYFTSDVGD